MNYLIIIPALILQHMFAMQKPKCCHVKYETQVIDIDLEPKPFYSEIAQNIHLHLPSESAYMQHVKHELDLEYRHVLGNLCSELESGRLSFKLSGNNSTDLRLGHVVARLLSIHLRQNGYPDLKVTANLEDDKVFYNFDNQI